MHDPVLASSMNLTLTNSVSETRKCRSKWKDPGERESLRHLREFEALMRMVAGWKLGSAVSVRINPIRANCEEKRVGGAL